jgi:hypothetical protein
MDDVQFKLYKAQGLNPDELVKHGFAIAIAYHPKVGILQGDKYHWDLFLDKRKQLDELDIDDADCLVGRIASFDFIYNKIEGRWASLSDWKFQANPQGDTKIISFWHMGGPRSEEKQFVINCLHEALKEQLITMQTIVVMHNTASLVSDWVSGANISQANRKPDAEVNKLKQLHLMNAQNKRKELLAIGAKPKRSPWELVPGQKHWSLHGESFKEWLINNI